MAKSFRESIIISIYSLIKNNGGYFKSEKQAKMMLGLEPLYLTWCRDTQWGNSCTVEVVLDEKGVKTLTRTSNTTFKVLDVYTRTLTLEKWQGQREYASRRSDMIRFLRDQASKYRDMYTDRINHPNAQYMSRFQKRIAAASSNMICHLAMQYRKDMTDDEKLEISNKIQIITLRRDNLYLTMQERGHKYNEMCDKIWDIIDQTDRNINNFQKLFPNY